MTPPAPKNRTAVNLLWLGFWIAVAWGGHWAIPSLFPSQRWDQDLRDWASVEGRSSEQSLEDEQSLRLQARQADARRRSELQSALGGLARAAMKDPSLSLTQALLAAATACAPTNTFPQIDIDRFTEFVITFNSQEKLPHGQMFQTARELIPLAGEFLESIRFSVRGEIVAELDRADIEFIPDWSRAPDDRIAMLLGRESSTRALGDTNLVERLRQEEQLGEVFQRDAAIREKAQRAETAFRDQMQSAWADLKSGVDLAFTASLNSARTLGDLDARGRKLLQARESLQRARPIFLNPQSAWEESLAAQGLAGESLGALSRAFPILFRDDSPKAALFFSAIDGQLESVAHFYRLLTDQLGASQLAGDADPNLASKIERARRQAVDDARLADQALKDWQDSLPR